MMMIVLFQFSLSEALHGVEEANRRLRTPPRDQDLSEDDHDNAFGRSHVDY